MPDAPASTPPRELTYQVQLRVSLAGRTDPIPAQDLTPAERSRLWATAVRELCVSFGVPPEALVRYAGELNSQAWSIVHRRDHEAMRAALQQRIHDVAGGELAKMADLVPLVG